MAENIAEAIAAKYREKYTDLDLTNFPVSEDNWARMSDISASLIAAEKQYQALWEAGNISGANALLDSNEGLRNAIFNADKWNKIRDGIIALQRFYLNDIQSYIEEVGKSAVGINDNPTEEERPLTAYSVEKMDELLSSLSNGITNVRNITLTSAGWAGTAAPFTQSISIAGITEDDVPTIGLCLETGDSSTSKNIEKSFSFVYTAVTGDGILTFYARKKPTVNIPLSVKGK